MESAEIELMGSKFESLQQQQQQQQQKKVNSIVLNRI